MKKLALVGRIYSKFHLFTYKYDYDFFSRSFFFLQSKKHSGDQTDGVSSKENEDNGFTSEEYEDSDVLQGLVRTTSRAINLLYWLKRKLVSRVFTLFFRFFIHEGAEKAR